jgi:tRNA 2-selenouridine synthase
MIHELDIRDFLKTNTPLVDVRSPGEYAHGHISGAVNIPLFSDEERAAVGTAYVQQSPEKAMELGLKYVEPKLQSFVKESKEISGDDRITVHCWRGGMRSHAFANHLHENGFGEVFVIKGGYKAFRQHVLEPFDIPCNIHIIGGYTGSGKTYVVRRLQELGYQAIDLEKIACHKGSAFGHIGEKNQPTTEQFENNLFDQCQNLNFQQPVWLEDESHNIGGVNIPLNLFHQMQNSPVYFLDIPKSERAKHLVSEYTGEDSHFLAESIQRISKRLGSQHAREALMHLEHQNFYEVAMITLQYYDKSYQKGMRFHDPNKIKTIPAKSVDHMVNTELIVKEYLNL